MIDYAGEFEVHVTVRAANAEALDRFRSWCLEHACKCVHIVLARGEHVDQPMATWRRGATTLPKVLVEAQQRTDDLARAAIAVVRVKIEAAADNEGVPQTDVDVADLHSANYFEHHVKLLRNAAAERELLVQTCTERGAHLSRNARRDNIRGQEVRFVTMRCYRVGRATAEQQLKCLLVELTSLGENIIEVESEYTVYDSNMRLDAGWLPQAM